MTAVAPFRASMQGELRNRLLDAARDLIERGGWSAVTMSRIAAAVGVSRQTVHNELGTRRQVAEHLAMRELERFLDVVVVRMRERDDVEDAVQWVCQGVLEMGENSLVVRTIVGSVPGEQDLELLKILTIESGEIVESASAVVKQSLLERWSDLPFTETELEVAVEAVVRLVLSAITRPSKSPADAAADIGWILRLALRGARA